jgi:esterase
MQRRNFQRDGVMLSYLDAGGSGSALVALHAHWMEGLTFAPLGLALAPKWRVIALDQRGHGHSDHAPTYTREDYLEDVAALFAHLSLGKAVVLGNSLGGVNAYQFAARYPGSVRALIVEDIGAEIGDDTSFALAWGGTFATKDELVERIGPRFFPYLQDSVRHTQDGWRLAFEPRDTVMSQSHLNGDHWQDWLASNCPALLLRGRQSRVTAQEQVEQMAARRARTRLECLEGGHVLHVDNPTAFTDTVKAFLDSLPE